MALGNKIDSLMIKNIILIKNKNNNVGIKLTYSEGGRTFVPQVDNLMICYYQETMSILDSISTVNNTD